MKLNRCLQAAAAVILFSGLWSCQKAATTPLNKITDTVTHSTAKKLNGINSFTTYIILAGGHYCEGNSYPFFEAPALYFTVQFDSSAVYHNINPHNQFDENKLYGFSDNNSLHHQFSARFGWRWCNGDLELSACNYNNGVCSDKA